MKFYTTDQIRDALQDRRIDIVAENLELSRDVLYNFLKGRTKKLNMDTYKKLIIYLFGEKDE